MTSSAVLLRCRGVTISAHELSLPCTGESRWAERDEGSGQPRPLAPAGANELTRTDSPEDKPAEVRASERRLHGAFGEASEAEAPPFLTRWDGGGVLLWRAVSGHDDVRGTDDREVLHAPGRPPATSTATSPSPAGRSASAWTTSAHSAYAAGWGLRSWTAGWRSPSLGGCARA